jgi:hypothetical protein
VIVRWFSQWPVQLIAAIATARQRPRVSYNNAQSQKVDPVTGHTISNAHPAAQRSVETMSDPGMFARIIGNQLSSVEFVHDYVQLRFDGPCLTLFVWPVLSSKDGRITITDHCYRDRLCSHIGKNVLDIDCFEAKYVKILLSDEIEFEILLSKPESGYFNPSGDPSDALLEF